MGWGETKSTMFFSEVAYLPSIMNKRPMWKPVSALEIVMRHT